MAFAIPAAAGIAGGLGASFLGGTSLSTAISVGSGLAGAASSLMGGLAGKAGADTQAQAALMAARAQAAAARYKAQVARNNKIIADQLATQAEQAGAVAATNKGLEGAAKLGALKAGQAASGLDVNKGSNVDVQESVRKAEKLDTETVFHNALLTAYGYTVQGTNFEAEARLDEMAAANAEAAGPMAAAAASASGEADLLRAGGSILSNASSLPFKFTNSGTGTSTGSTTAAPVWPGT